MTATITADTVRSVTRTKTTITKSANLGVDPELGAWIVQCPHGTLALATTERKAKALKADSFCRKCAEGDPAWMPEVAAAAEQLAAAKANLEAVKEHIRVVIAHAKEQGASDRKLAATLGVTEMTIREWRGVRVRSGGKIVSS